MTDISLTLYELMFIIPPLLIIEGFYSGSEIALLSADKVQLNEKALKGSKSAKLALNLVAHPEKILSVTLLTTSFFVVLISSLVAFYTQQTYENQSGLIAILITSPMVVIIGEFLPKLIYQRFSTRVSTIVAFPILFTYYLFYPITRFLTLYTSRLTKIVQPIGDLITGKTITIREEIVSMISYGKKESSIKSSEKKMIKRIFDFKETEAKHALIPLVNVKAISSDSTIHDALTAFDKYRHSRIPVYSERIDNIIGILPALELMDTRRLDNTIKSFIKPAHYVAETQAVEDILFEMQDNKSEMTVVVDEHGGAVGILTFEDIVEEIVGEITDEDELETQLYNKVSENSWLIKAQMETQQINEELKLELPEGEYETLAGFLLQQFNRIPEPKDELFFDTPAGSITFTIKHASKRRIEKVLVELKPK